MTDTEVIETLARREGRSEILFVPPYLTSLDALRPVLEKLSEKEWSDLTGSLWAKAIGSPQRGISVGRFLLTLPPATLARAIAEVIKETK